MRWTPKRHTQGHHRIVRRFAWLPIRLKDGDKVWLEPYWIVQVQQGCGDYTMWEDLCKPLGTRKEAIDMVQHHNFPAVVSAAIEDKKRRVKAWWEAQVRRGFVAPRNDAPAPTQPVPNPSNVTGQEAT